MKEIGRVVETIGGKAKIRIMRQASCAKCGACGMGENPMVELDLENTLGACVGDHVMIELESTRLVRAAVWMYLLPLFALLLGYAVGEYTAKRLGIERNEAVGVIFSFGAMFLTFMGLRWADQHWFKPSHYLPRMTDLASPSSEEHSLEDSP